MKILMIENDHASALLLNTFLLRLFHEKALVVKNINDALSVLSLGGVGFIFLDLHLDYNETGLSFLIEREFVQAYREIPVIILSAYSDLGIMIDCFKHGANGFLIKPVQEQLVKAQLEKFGII